MTTTTDPKVCELCGPHTQFPFRETANQREHTMRTIETVTKRAEDLTDQDIVYIGRSWVHVSTVECDEHMSVKVRGSVNGGWDKEPTSVTHFYSCFDLVSVQLEVVR